ncbi:nucleotidyl transferase AbiEii/AbiGii toxin family protein [Candidatus Dojkabacteria bacterium]|nr:nucleotidyl transferase AbiEii/AbiGii toxin family protein [Candidatus Dojkabacteria bacterium]
MISLREIKENYPQELQSFSLGILREYIQYKILEIIYSSRFNNNLIFMGGTSLRIIYNNQRFSEDLNFDNLGLTKENFEKLVYLVKNALQNEGFDVETKVIYKKAFHCYIKIPEILFKEGLSGLPNQKITIRIDTTPQNYDYKVHVYLLDKFDVYQNAQVVPIETLMSQKIAALLERERTKGRDFFDISFMISRGIKPDVKYLKEKLNLKTLRELKIALLKRSNEVNLKELAEEVKSFLFKPSQSSRIINFPDQIQQIAE